MNRLKESIENGLLTNGLGSKGDEELSPLLYPQRSLHILLATSGSVASIKTPLIVRELLKYEQVEVQVVATQASLHFYESKSIQDDTNGESNVWVDKDEWEGWSKIGDPILHIELRRWADIVLIAPCSANTLAKLANGYCDNLLTSLLRAMPAFIPVLLFPAMNTHMYSHPLTNKQLSIVKDDLGYEVHGPIAKTLACGDIVSRIIDVDALTDTSKSIERSYGSFARSIAVPPWLKQEEVKAKLRDGLLKVEIPKIVRESQAKKIEVE